MNDPSYFCILYTTGNKFESAPNQACLSNLAGVTNLNVAKSKSFSQPFFVGGYKNDFILNSPNSLEISIDRTLYEANDNLYLTGNEFIRRFYVYDTNKFYEFCNLYLNSFRIQFSVGSLPTVNYKFTSYGESNKIVDIISYPYTKIEPSLLEIPNVKNIFVCQSVFSNVCCNRNIFSFDYSLSINRQPFFSVGLSTPIEVSQIQPIEISSTINSKATAQTNTNTDLQNFENLKCYTNFSIIACNSNDNTSWEYKMCCGGLISTKAKISSTDVIEYEDTYIGYIK
jgi:hypothetical protein